MASLEVLLGVAAAVVLLGVLAVRVSVRLGLPSSCSTWRSASCWASRCSASGSPTPA